MMKVGKSWLTDKHSIGVYTKRGDAYAYYGWG